eukprot:1145683-Pelagomonas_calceolata.AAC.4
MHVRYPGPGPGLAHPGKHQEGLRLREILEVRYKKHVILAAQRTSVYISTVEKDICFGLILIARSPVTHRCSILPNSRFKL